MAYVPNVSVREAFFGRISIDRNNILMHAFGIMMTNLKLQSRTEDVSLNVSFSDP
jgi:hypothetical protein